MQCARTAHFADVFVNPLYPLKKFLLCIFEAH